MQHHNETCSPKAALKRCARKATDADLHAYNLQCRDQQYDQLSNGRLFGRKDNVDLAQDQIFTNILIRRCVSNAKCGQLATRKEDAHG